MKKTTSFANLLEERVIVKVSRVYDIYPLHDGHEKVQWCCQLLAGDFGKPLELVAGKRLYKTFGGNAYLCGGRQALVEVCRHVQKLLPNSTFIMVTTDSQLVRTYVPARVACCAKTKI